MAGQQRSAHRSGQFPPLPEALPVPVVDSHTHLDLTGSEAAQRQDTGPGAPAGAAAPPGPESADAPVLPGPGGDDPIAALVAAALAVGVDRLVQVGVDVESSQWGVALAERSPAVLATVALHPNEAPRLADLDEALRRIEKLATHPRVRGIGETGLDWFRTGPQGRAAQEESFRAHIAIAKRYDRALVIHDRDAHDGVLRVLDEEGAPARVVMHCFSGDAEFAAACVRRGFWLSFAGTVSFANAAGLRAAAGVTPVEQLLVETDAPYLTPTPYRGRPNASYLIPLTARALAGATGVELPRLCEALSANGERVFGPWR